MSKRVFFIFVTVLFGSVVTAQQYKDVISSYPSYKPESIVSGTLTAIGSDTLNNLMTFWAEGFQKFHPGVKIEIEGKGSSTAPPALIEGTAQLGPMSRKMKRSEIDKFEKVFGYKPTAVKVALDGLAIYVNMENPLDSLSIPEVDAIFSKTRYCGYPNDISSWSDIESIKGWSSRRISLYGRNSASGTYAFFKKVALCKGDFKDQVKEQPGSSSVVQSVVADKFSIGYSGIGYKTSGVKVLALAREKGGKPYTVSYDNVVSGKYPLGRFLYIYINDPPTKQVDKMIKEFFRFIFSKEGQSLVVQAGYLPIPFKVAVRELGKIK